jgi:CHRD domain
MRLASMATILCSLLAVACGGGSSNPTPTPTPSPTPSPTPTPAPTFQIWPVPDGATALAGANLTAFAPGNLYYNAHTPANPGGEIRGQLDKLGTIKLAVMDGAQEAPTAITTTAFGASMVIVDEATGNVSGFLITSGLVGATAAHIHIGARGVAGPVIVPMTGGPDLWVIPDNATPLTAAQITAWQSGGLYVNAHTPTNPSGEIRGQLDKIGTVKFAGMNGAQEVPATTSTAFGGGVLIVDPGTGKPGGFVVTSLTNGTLAHVHNGAAGVAGGVIVPMTGGATGLWVIPDGAAALAAADQTAFTANNLYYNVHTAANPGGEIRGQIRKGGTGSTFKMASLSPAQETTTVTGSTAFGSGVLGMDGTTGDVGGFLLTSGLTGATAAHVHNGARGVAGPVIVPLSGP